MRPPRSLPLLPVLLLALSGCGAGGNQAAPASFAGPEAAAQAAPRPAFSSRLLVAIEGGGAVTLDATTGRVVSTYATGANAFGALYSADGRRAFVTDKTAGTLVEIDPGSNAVLNTIPVGAEPQQPALAADGRMFIPLSGEAAVAVVDVNARAVLRKILTGQGSKPHIVSLSPDGHTLWATVQGADPKVVSIAIGAQGEGQPREHRYNLVPRVVFATDTGAYFTAHHSTGIHYVGLADGKITTPYLDKNGPFSEPAKQIEGVAASADGRHVAFTHEGRKALVVLSVGGTGKPRKVLDAAPLSNKPYWTLLDPTGKIAYVSIPDSGTVEAYDISSELNRPLWTAQVGGKAKRMATI